jgi:hypothetical protein
LLEALRCRDFAATGDRQTIVDRLQGVNGRTGLPRQAVLLFCEYEGLVVYPADLYSTIFVAQEATGSELTFESVGHGL